MTREELENALHCLKVMIDEEVCEECNLYGTTGTDHCEADCVRVAIEALKEQMSYSEEPNKWIPISKETPKENGYYLTTTMYGEVFCDYWDSDRFDRTETVLAWQELPLPYKAESEE